MNLATMIFKGSSAGLAVPENVELPGDIPAAIEKTGARAAVELIGGVQYGGRVVRFLMIWPFRSS